MANDTEESHGQVIAGTIEHARKDISADRVRAQQMAGARCLQRLQDIDLDRIEAGQHGCRGGTEAGPPHL